MTGHLVALDVGGTAMKGGVISADGSVLLSESRPTGREHGPDAVVENILGFAAHLAGAAGPVVAAGIALPGIVDDASGTAVLSAHIGWRDVPFRDLAVKRLGVPVAVAHDVRTGGLGEAVRGAGRGSRDFLFVPIGTGIAAALMINNAPYPGATGWSGELGHIVVRPGGEPCPCGNRGCLEPYAAASAIPRRYAALAGLRASPRAEEVVRLAQAGDPVAAKVWDEAVAALADALANVTMLLDPSQIVIGGGLSGAGTPLFDPLAERLKERLPLRPPPPLTRARLGTQAAMHGAAELARRALKAAE
ncbi:ROK family protein [Spirillospora sp. CA-294931]|uniref:ROK family protein n=1 Tax=Spirillospora sp. CA-294931 TaxID=3240042 RepID=UPI003D8D2E90